jgi:hypothetical protein
MEHTKRLEGRELMEYISARFPEPSTTPSTETLTGLTYSVIDGVYKLRFMVGALPVSISARHIGELPPMWNGGEDWHRAHCHNKVTVTNLTNSKRLSFDFWASLSSPELRGVSDLVEAFYCFLADCESGQMLYSDFCSEFGYEEHITLEDDQAYFLGGGDLGGCSMCAEGVRIYKACVTHLNEFSRVFGLGWLEDMNETVSNFINE